MRRSSCPCRPISQSLQDRPAHLHGGCIGNVLRRGLAHGNVIRSIRFDSPSTGRPLIDRLPSPRPFVQRSFTQPLGRSASQPASRSTASRKQIAWLLQLRQLRLHTPSRLGDPTATGRAAAVRSSARRCSFSLPPRSCTCHLLSLPPHRLLIVSLMAWLTRVSGRSGAAH